MNGPGHPYKTQPESAFWRASVGQRHCTDLTDVWQPISIHKSDRIATAGSCFSQRIGNNLVRRGATFMDMEPAPPVFNTLDEARRWGYGVFSCRYGNIYTSRQLLQLFDEAHGDRIPGERVWEKGGRYFDALRPGIDPVGQAIAGDVIELRQRHLDAVRKMFAQLDVFVFTMGLTEGWELRSDGTMFAVAPGTIAGSYQPDRYRFRNLRAHEIIADITEFWHKLRRVNASARMLLTVSPVPMAATATENHILVANSYSKSTLRVVAGDLAQDLPDVHYFPSYEMVASHNSRGMFYEPDLRHVNQSGVNLVMDQFFLGALADEFSPELDDGEEQGLICEESQLDTSA